MSNTNHQPAAPPLAPSMALSNSFAVLSTQATPTRNISTIPAEIHLDILFYLLLPAAQQLWQAHREVSKDDLRRLIAPLSKTTLPTAVSADARAYLQASEVATACWAANRMVLSARLARGVRRETEPILKAVRRAKALARLRFVAWAAAAREHGSPHFHRHRQDASRRLDDVSERLFEQIARDRLLSFYEDGSWR